MSTPRPSDFSFIQQSPEETRALAAEMLDAGDAVFTLQGSSNTASFFEVARRELPLDPMLGPFPNWNAFTDSLSNGIDAIGDRKVVLIWKDPHVMRCRDPSGFRRAVQCLKDVVELLRSERAMNRTEVRGLRVILCDSASDRPPLGGESGGDSRMGRRRDV